MDVDDLTIREVKRLQAMFGAGEPGIPIVDVGRKVFIRTVTHHYTGRVTACNPAWLELEEAAWIAYDGRFHECLANGTPDEVEPFVDWVRIPVGSIIDLTPWNHDLPQKVK